MDFTLDEERTAYRDLARDFAVTELAPNAARWDADAEFPIPTLRKAAELGLAAITVRQASGGPGLGRFDAALIFEELAAGCTATAAYLSIHNMVGWMIDRFGDDDQRARHLPSLITMDRLASYCLTEPGSGSDAASLATRAVLDGEDYVVDGAKAFISGAGASDLYLTMARTGGPGPGGVSCLAIAKDTAGLSFGAPERKLGWNSQPTAAVRFEGCRVPVVERIGAEGEGFRIAMAGLDGGRVNIAACAIGTARAAFEAARRYLGERHQFGQPLAAFQALRFRLADMATELEAARLMVWRAAAALDAAEQDAGVRCAMAKRFATDVAFKVCDEALQLHGGYGYLRDFPLERHLRDVRVHRILEGTNEIMRLIIARRLLDDSSAAS